MAFYYDFTRTPFVLVDLKSNMHRHYSGYAELILLYRAQNCIGKKPDKRHKYVFVSRYMTGHVKDVTILESRRLPVWNCSSIFGGTVSFLGCGHNPPRRPRLLCSQPFTIGGQGNPGHQKTITHSTDDSTDDSAKTPCSLWVEDS